MVEDVSFNYEEGKLPMLDFRIWKHEELDQEGVKKTIMRTEFYEKKMVSKRMLMERSSLPKKVKVSSLAQMVIRRCSNQVGGGSK